MKKLISVCTLALLAFSVSADPGKNHKDHKDQKHHKNHRQRHEPSTFDVKPLNSPVKDGMAKFSLNTPKNFEIDQVMFKVKDANKILLKEKDYEPTKLVQGSSGKELHIPVSNLANGFYRLYVRVRTEEKAKPKSRYHEHDYKNSYHDYVRFVIEKKTGVVMPDPVKNDATVAGIDSDNDGIRDDIQIWINQQYASQPTVKLGVQQLARTAQLRLLAIGDKEQSVQATRNYLLANSCMSHVAGGDEGFKIGNKLKSKLLNTRDRLYASMRASENFSGESMTLPKREEKKTLCDFNTDNQ